MTFYSDLAETSLEMLTEFGASVTLRAFSVGGSDYDPNTGLASASSGYTDSTRKGLLLDQPGSQIQRKFGETMGSNSLIQNAEKWVYLDASGNAPRLQDHLIVQGLEYTIVDVQVTAPSGVPLLYLLVLKS